MRPNPRHHYSFPIVGITGSIASGKSTVCELWAQRGAKVIDADQLTRTLTAPGTPALEEIARHFGPAILNDSGELNRAALAARVFQNDQDRRWLEALLHPLVRLAFRDALDTTERSPHASELPFFVYAAPLLIEAGVPQELDALVVVSAPDETLITRAIARGSLTADQARQRLAQQLATTEKLKHATHLIDNSGSREELITQAESLFEQLKASLRANRHDAWGSSTQPSNKQREK